MMTTTTTKSNLAAEQALATKRGAMAPAHLGHDDMHRASLTPFRTQLPTARAALQDITSAVAAACAATNNGTVNTKPPPPPPPPQLQPQPIAPQQVPTSTAAAPPHQVRVRPIPNNAPPQQQQQQQQFVSKRPLVVDDGDDALFAALDVDALVSTTAISKNGASNQSRAPISRSLDNDDDVFANFDIDRVAREYQSSKGRVAAAPPTTSTAAASRPSVSSAVPTTPSTTTAAAPFTRRSYYATLSLERLTEMRNKMAQLVDDLIMSNVATRDESAEYGFFAARAIFFLRFPL